MINVDILNNGETYRVCTEVEKQKIKLNRFALRKKHCYGCGYWFLFERYYYDKKIDECFCYDCTKTRQNAQEDFINYLNKEIK